MTTIPKTRNAPAVDPIFAAITEHKALIKEFYLHQSNFHTARAEAEKKHGVKEWHSAQAQPTEFYAKNMEATKLACAETTPQYDLFNGADSAAFKAAMRMARTKPKTLAGVAALADYLWWNHSAGEIDERDEEWATIALKTIATSLDRMIGEQRQAVAELVPA